MTIKTSDSNTAGVDVFLTPNATTLLLARAVIRVRKLSNAILLLTRNLQSELSSENERALNFTWDDFSPNRSARQLIERIKDLDDWINTNIATAFRAYLPHHKLPLYNLISSHRLCESWSYLEEGTAAYFTPKEYLTHLGTSPKSVKHKAKEVKRFVSSLGRITAAQQMFKEGYCTAYKINPTAFPGMRSVTIPKVFNTSVKKESIGTRRYVIAMPRNGVDWISGRNIAWIIESIAPFLNRMGANSILIKTHPQNLSNEDFGVREVLERNKIRLDFLHQSSFLENLLSERKTTVLSFGSSIELYASWFPGIVVPVLALSGMNAEINGDYTSYWPSAARAHIDATIKRGAMHVLE